MLADNLRIIRNPWVGKFYVEIIFVGTQEFIFHDAYRAGGFSGALAMKYSSFWG
jgi:hypothetical protein